MEKKPRKSKQWAKEASGALDVAWGLLREKHPVPTEEQKIGLIDFAPPIAALNRGISDKELVGHAYTYAVEKFARDFHSRDTSEPMNYSISFLLAYLDSQVSFGFLTGAKAEDAMQYLSDHYDLSFEGAVNQENHMFK